MKLKIGLRLKLVFLVLTMLILFLAVYWNIENWSQTKQKQNWNSTMVTNYRHILNSVLTEKKSSVENALSAILYSPEITSFIAGDMSDDNKMVLSGFFLTFAGTVQADGFFILDTQGNPIFQETGSNGFTLEKNKLLETLCKKSSETFGYEGAFVTIDSQPRYLVVTPLLDINDTIKGYIAVTVESKDIASKFAHILQGKIALSSPSKELLYTTDSSIIARVNQKNNPIMNGSVAQVDTISYRVYSLPLERASKVGDFSIFTDATKEIKENKRIDSIGLFASITTLFVVIFLIVAIISHQIAPLSYITKVIQEIQITGNLKTRVIQKSHDEIGVLADAFNSLLETLAEIIRKISISSQEIGGLLEKITSFASHLNTQNKLASQHIGQVTNSAQGITEELRGVAHESQHNAEGIGTIASVVNELSSSVNSVAENCRSESEIANEASLKVIEIKNIVTSLDNKLMAISKATHTIAMIAKETTLLSINASVEAARAGESGKGFSVVANEVKKMASETSKVSEEITTQVQEIQNQSKVAVENVAVLTETLQQIKNISSDINTAVDEQNLGLREVSSTTQDANGFVSKLSDIMTEVNTSMLSCRTDSDTLVSQIESFKDEYRLLEAIVEKFQV